MNTITHNFTLCFISEENILFKAVFTSIFIQTFARRVQSFKEGNTEG